MSYLDICIIGWNLNALMFVVNFLIAIRVISTQDRSKLHEESLVLKELKEDGTLEKIAIKWFGEDNITGIIPE